MPGIFGFVDRNGNLLPENLALKMANSMKHEDWYVAKWVSNSCSLGAVELESMYHNDLVFDDGTSWLGVSRGNIYNKEELSRKFNVRSTTSYSGDARFFVELFEKEGLDFAEWLNGLFVAAIYDKEKDRVVIVNDRYGYHPLFYSLNSERFLFASEAKAILEDSIITPRMNKRAIPEQFAFSYLLDDKTFFEDVKSMPPACIMIYDRKRDQVNLKRYWDFSLKRSETPKPLSHCLKDFCRLMKRSVERRVEDKEEVGIFLSSGLDSRIIAAFASECKTATPTFTFVAKDCRDQKIASEVAESLGLENITYEIPSDFISRYAEQIVYRGDGLIRIRDSHFIALLGKVRQRVDTVLLGTFGGDLAWPYSLTERLLRLKNRREVRDYLLKYYVSKLSNVLPIEKHHKAFTEEFFKEIQGVIEHDFNNMFGSIPFSSPSDLADYWEYRHREPRYIFQAQQHINWYLETRHPFMDNDVVEFLAFKFPPHLRRKEIFGVVVHNTFLQKVIDYRFPSLSQIEWHGFLPNSNRLTLFSTLAKMFVQSKINPKLRKLLRKNIPLNTTDFRTYDNWLRHGSKAYVEDLLLNPRTLERDVFRPDFIKKTVKNHMDCKENHNQLICDLLNFELLNRIFFDHA